MPTCPTPNGSVTEYHLIQKYCFNKTKLKVQNNPLMETDPNITFCDNREMLLIFRHCDSKIQFFFFHVPNEHEFVLYMIL